MSPENRKGGQWLQVRSDIWIGLAFLVVAILLPLFQVSNYALTQITLFFIWAAVVTQWNLVFGVAGVFSLGHMAVFAVGGYSAAMLSLYQDISLWIALPFGALVAVAFSLLMGLTTLRLRGPYVAVMTFAIAQALYSLIITDVDCFVYEGQLCLNFTGGAKGLIRFGDFGFKELLGFKFRLLGDYYLALTLLALGMVFAFLVIYSPLGSTFSALRDNQTCAEARGVNRVRFQMLVFAVSGVFTGLAGGVFAGIQKTIGPDVLTLPLLLFLLSMMVVGGKGTRWGPILGAGALMLADTLLREFSEIRNFGLALIIILAILFLPRGLVGLVHDIFHWMPRSLVKLNRNDLALRSYQRNKSQERRILKRGGIRDSGQVPPQ